MGLKKKSKSYSLFLNTGHVSEKLYLVQLNEA